MTSPVTFNGGQPNPCLINAQAKGESLTPRRDRRVTSFFTSPRFLTLSAAHQRAFAHPAGRPGASRLTSLCLGSPPQCHRDGRASRLTGSLRLKLTGKHSACCPGDVNRLYYSPVFLHINASWFSVLRIRQRQPNSRTGRPSHQHAHGDFVTSSGARRQARPAPAAKLAEDLDPLRGGEKPDTKGRLPAGRRDRKCAV